MRLVGGIGLVGLALFMALGFVLSESAMSLPVAIISIGVAVVLPAATGLLLLRSHAGGRIALSRRQDQLRRETWEAEILRLAGEHGGKLTVVEATRALAIGSTEVEATLRALAERGVADLEMTDDGLLVYAFPDVRRLPGKHASKDLLDG